MRTFHCHVWSRRVCSFHITCASFRTCQGNLEVTGHRCADPKEPKFAAWKSSLRMLARPQGLLVEQLYPAPKSWKCILWCFNYNNTLNILLTLNLRKVASHQLLHVQHRPKKGLKACLAGWKDGCHSFAPLSRPPVWWRCSHVFAVQPFAQGLKLHSYLAISLVPYGSFKLCVATVVPRCSKANLIKMIKASSPTCFAVLVEGFCCGQYLGGDHGYPWRITGWTTGWRTCHARRIVLVIHPTALVDLFS